MLHIFCSHLYLGAHMPITGGLHKAVERIRALGGTALQIFTCNQRQWRSPELDPEKVAAFARARNAWGEYPVAAHGSYLVNLASPDADLAARSVQAFASEIERVGRLGVPLLVIHPGAHRGQGMEAGLAACAANLDRSLDMAREQSVTVLLENTAGQGTMLGSRAWRNSLRSSPCRAIPSGWACAWTPAASLPRAMTCAARQAKRRPWPNWSAPWGGTGWGCCT